eukprot:scaffold464_cov181-Amphora_coffeaeformis.AAC.14
MTTPTKYQKDKDYMTKRNRSGFHAEDSENHSGDIHEEKEEVALKSEQQSDDARMGESEDSKYEKISATTKDPSRRRQVNDNPSSPHRDSKSDSPSTTKPRPVLESPSPVLVMNDDLVTFMGSDPDRALCVIPPPPQQRDDDVEMIRQLNQIYSKPSIRNWMTRVAKQSKDRSIRLIQSNRFEVFVRNASNKGSHFWDAVLQQSSLPADCTDRLCAYAVAQARRDPRISRQPFKFGNFSLICSYGRVPAQAPHVDLLPPNHQFAVILTGDSPSTIMYDVKNRVQSMEDLKRLWQSMEREGEEPSFPSCLAQALETSSDVTSLLKDFGDVLHSSADFPRVQRGLDHVLPGTVLSLPGGVTHAGPATNSFRAVLFFSAVPIDNQQLEYNPDVQFSSIVWTGSVLLTTWRRAGMTKEARLYLLRRLATYIRQANKRSAWDCHFHEEVNLQRIVRKIASNMNDQSLDTYLAEQAEKEDLFNYILVHTDPAGTKNPHEFECVSHPQLRTQWGNEIFPLSIYTRKADGKVVLYYPPKQNAQGQVEEASFEGDQANEKYTLVMHEVGEIRFNGKNGTLRDKEGEEIKLGVDVSDWCQDLCAHKLRCDRAIRACKASVEYALFRLPPWLPQIISCRRRERQRPGIIILSVDI